MVGGSFSWSEEISCGQRKRVVAPLCGSRSESMVVEEQRRRLHVFFVFSLGVESLVKVEHEARGEEQGGGGALLSRPLKRYGTS